MSMVLEDVGIGERLIADSAWGGGTYVVERLTQTMIVCKGGVRFNRENGCRIGEATRRGWGRTRVRKMTEADFIKERISVALTKLGNFKVTPENIEQVEQFLLTAKPSA